MYRQKAPHWVPTEDGFGGYTFATPTHLDVRWEVKREVFTDGAGREQVSRAIVYTRVDITVDDYLALGDLTGQADPQAANLETYQVRAFQKSTDLRNVRAVRKVFL